VRQSQSGGRLSSLRRDQYFARCGNFRPGISRGIDQLLDDPKVTSVRLVTNAEKWGSRTTTGLVLFSWQG